MERTELIEKVAAALGEVLQRDVTGAVEETRLFDDLQLDSTAVLELLMALEDNVGFEVDPESIDMDDFKTIGSLADYIGRAADLAV